MCVFCVCVCWLGSPLPYPTPHAHPIRACSPLSPPQALVTAHSLGFWSVWLYMGEWKQEALDFGARRAGGGQGEWHVERERRVAREMGAGSARGAGSRTITSDHQPLRSSGLLRIPDQNTCTSRRPRVNNLMGGVSFIGGLALWLTSLEAPRRAAYSLFYAAHHVRGAGARMPCLPRLSACLPGLPACLPACLPGGPACLPACFACLPALPCLPARRGGTPNPLHALPSPCPLPPARPASGCLWRPASCTTRTSCGGRAGPPPSPAVAGPSPAPCRARRPPFPKK